MKLAAASFVVLFASGCGNPPPASQMPNAKAALDRLHQTQDCGVGIHAQAKIDHFGEQGRVRGDLLLYSMWPANMRLDVIGPMNVGIVSTLTSDSQRFSLADMRDKRFLVGPAKACNIARLTTVPMPGHVLVSLLRGEAPVLKHEEAGASITWNGKGYYVVKIASTRESEEEIHLAPHPADFGLAWDKQRLRLLDVEVKQQGIVLYHAQLDDHKSAEMSKPQVDPDGIDPPVPVSGPVCSAEVPRKIHVEVPNKDEDVLFRYDNVTWNPPVQAGTFTQPEPSGMRLENVNCED